MPPPVVEATTGRGITSALRLLEDDVSTLHHPNQVHAQYLRPLRCLRHHVSMAACADCRSVRTAQIERERMRADAAG